MDVHDDSTTAVGRFKARRQHRPLMVNQRCWFQFSIRDQSKLNELDFGFTIAIGGEWAKLRHQFSHGEREVLSASKSLATIAEETSGASPNGRAKRLCYLRGKPKRARPLAPIGVSSGFRLEPPVGPQGRKRISGLPASFRSSTVLLRLAVSWDGNFW